MPQLFTSVMTSGWLVSWPSQLLSTPQPSTAPGTGTTEPTHCTAPLTHAVLPALHGEVAPAGGGVGTLHMAPICAEGRLLSVVPSQSLSTPSQVSGDGSMLPTQVFIPPTHWSVPF